MKPFKAFPSHHPTPNGSHAKGWVRREWEQGSWTEGCLGMGPGRPIEAHHRRHWALIVGSTSPRERVSRLRLYTYSTLDIIYYILYLISSILYSVQYIYEPGWKTRKEISVLRVRTFSATRFACKTRAYFFLPWGNTAYSLFFFRPGESRVGIVRIPILV